MQVDKEQKCIGISNLKFYLPSYVVCMIRSKTFSNFFLSKSSKMIPN